MRATFVALAALSSLTAQMPTQLRDVNATNSLEGVEYDLARTGNAWIFRGRAAGSGDEVWVSTVPSYATSLLRDIYPGPSGSGPDHLTAAGNKVLFVADDGTHGLELWVTDGTTAGTTMVKDIRPGSSPGIVLNASRRRVLTAVGNDVYFVADDGVTGAELWRSDGTPAGTRLVIDLAPGAASAGIHEIASAGNRVFFNGRSGSNNFWATDGTAAGTIPLGAFYAAPYALTALGNTMFFVASQAGVDYEPWKSDGTAAGTVLVKDIHPTGSSYPAGFTPFGSRMFFVADDGTHGLEPWISDGTPAGTTLLRDVAPGAASSMPGNYLQEWVVLGGRVVFGAHDGASGAEPWVSDGTTNGTTLLRDVRPGAGSSLALSGFSIWRRAQGDGARAWFAADDGVAGRELWTTDGTTAGTVLAADLIAGGGSSSPARIVTDGSGGALVLADSPTAGALWRATATGASLISTAASRAPHFSRDSNAREFTPLGSRLLFAADDGTTGHELWGTDGTPAGTAQVRDMDPGAGYGFQLGDPEIYYPGSFRATRLGNELFYAGYDATLAVGLWKTDGTPAGTVKLRALDRTPNGHGYFIEGDTHRDRLFFTAFASGYGWSLFFTDGSNAGTFRLHSRLGGDYANFSRVVRLGNAILWFAGSSSGGIVLSRIDTTTGVLQQVALVASASRGVPLSPVRLGNRLLFLVPTNNDNAALWATDGSTATALLPVVGAGTWARRQLVRFGDHVYFMAGSTAAGVELWRSDGTPAGTTPFADLIPGATGSSPRSFAVAGDRLYFGADDGANVALWGSDGTVAGTTRIASLPGSGYAPPDILYTTAVGSRRVYFSLLYGAETGSELWRSDGTLAGTALVTDLYPGTGGPPPRSLTPHRGRLVFAADDFWGGIEPWVLHPGATAMAHGAGCAASGFDPELRATDPVLGASLTFAVRDAVANAAGVALFGAPSFPEQQLGRGCALAVVPTGSVGVAFTTDAAGRFTAPPLGVPNDPALVDAQLALQAAIGPTANVPLPVDFSNGVLLTFGQ